MRPRFAAAAVLAVSLAACGSNDPAASPDAAAPATMPSGMPMAAASDMPMADASGVPMANASGMPMAHASVAPMPSPSESASVAPSPAPASTPTKVAAAGPPEAFKQCSVCHSTEPGKTLIGPSLAGVVGRKAGTEEGFKYSQAMKDSGITWTAAELDTYLTDPKKEVPGTTMALAGIKDPAKRADIIAYLKTL